MYVFRDIGRYSLLLYKAFRSLPEFSMYRKNLLNELVKTGWESLPITIITGVFTGAVMTLQTAYQLVSAFVPKSAVGAIVSQSLIIELAAVIPSLVLAGRVGARIATELGNMRVTEQIDALESMGLNSVTFLVLPRTIAGLFMFPMLYIIASATGVLGGMASGYFTDLLPISDYLKGAREYFFPQDVAFGIVKSFVFGYIITSISSFKGYFASGGAEGVGKATTQATVLSCVYILFADFILAYLLL